MIKKTININSILKAFCILISLSLFQFSYEKCYAKINIREHIVSYFIFSPENELKETPSDYGLQFEEVFINLPNEKQLYGWYIFADKPTDKNIIYLHGVKGNISSYLDGIKKLHKTGANILLVDYEGFGKSTGHGIVSNSINDSLAMYDFLIQDKKVKAENISLYGFSYGGAIALEVALKRKVHAILLEATFSSFKEIAIAKCSRFILPLVPRNLLNSKENIKKINVPIVIAYAQKDRLIKDINSKKLHGIANAPKYLYEIKYAGHYDISHFVTNEYLELIKKVLT